MPRGRVLFPAVSYVRGLVGREAGLDTHRGLPVVVDCSHIESLDYTAAAQFKDLLADLHSRQQQVFWLRKILHHRCCEHSYAILFLSVDDSFFLSERFSATMLSSCRQAEQ